MIIELIPNFETSDLTQLYELLSFVKEKVLAVQNKESIVPKFIDTEHHEDYNSFLTRHFSTDGPFEP